jgi:hypothetical protein
MKTKDGQYYYAPHRRQWGVWQYHDHGNGYGSGTFVKDLPTKEDARKEVYRLNGWSL